MCMGFLTKEIKQFHLFPEKKKQRNKQTNIQTNIQTKESRMISKLILIVLQYTRLLIKVTYLSQLKMFS